MTLHRLTARPLEKVWGREGLPAMFGTEPERRIGEVWFDPPAQLAPLLVKYLFTSDKLSVQVHPAGGAASGLAGKDECWLVLEAEAEARLAIGLLREMDAATLHAAALDGSIENVLVWHTPRKGDFFYIPAGTIHAVGSGITLIEVQQNCDVTYRLYDYGRPRELHLDAAIGVAHAAPWSEKNRRRVDQGNSAMLVDGPHFRVAHLAGGDWSRIGPAWSGPVQVVPIAGEVRCGDACLGPGESGWTEAIGDADFAPTGRALVAQPLSG